MPMVGPEGAAPPQQGGGVEQIMQAITAQIETVAGLAQAAGESGQQEAAADFANAAKMLESGMSKLGGGAPQAQPAQGQPVEA